MGGEVRGGTGGAILLVVADDVEREAFGSGLEAAGYDVLTCPGPTRPDYTCVGGREGVCPLVHDADTIVLDMSLDSEAVVSGTSAEELLSLYLDSDRPVIVLGSRPGEEVPERLVRLPRHPGLDRLLGALRSAGRP
jgi:hypothetical protein